MEALYGRRRVVVDRDALAARLVDYTNVLIDIGTGDGRFMRHVARTSPVCFAIGVDACRENLREATRKAPANALYVVANALALPPELRGLATWITINFPWGSLLDGLLRGDDRLLDGLRALARPGARLEIRLNDGALAEAGCTPEDGERLVARMLRECGFAPEPSLRLRAADLRACPTSWAKKLAYGREPRGWYLEGTYRVEAMRHASYIIRYA